MCVLQAASASATGKPHTASCKLQAACCKLHPASCAPVVQVHVVGATAAPKLRLRGTIRLLLLAGAAITNADEDACCIIPALDVLQLVSFTRVACKNRVVRQRALVTSPNLPPTLFLPWFLIPYLPQQIESSQGLQPDECVGIIQQYKQKLSSMQGYAAARPQNSC
jgi:hypothetical protein